MLTQKREALKDVSVCGFAKIYFSNKLSRRDPPSKKVRIATTLVSILLFSVSQRKNNQYVEKTGRKRRIIHP